MGGKMKKKRKESLIGYTIKNWGMLIPESTVKSYNFVKFDNIYKKKSELNKVKVRITIEEI